MKNEIIIPSQYAIESIIEESISSATQVINEYNSENSKRAFTSDLEYWQVWFKANNLPNVLKQHTSSHENVLKQHIILFIMQHAENMPPHIDEILIKQGKKAKSGTHKLSTIERRLASLSRYLQLSKKHNPCNDKDILILMRKLTEKHGPSKAWGEAITLDILNAMLQTCQPDGLIGIRDIAILLFGFSTGGRRRSEIASAKFENLKKNSDRTFLYNLGKSKTNQEGNEDYKPIVGRASIALMNWIDVSGLSDGPIFRAIRKGGIILPHGLSNMQISRIVKSRCKKAGLDPSKYTAHSLRSGFVTEGGKRGKTIGDIMALTGHKSISTVMRYYQTGAILNNSAAYLAG